jgi:hypothetical protein
LFKESFDDVIFIDESTVELRNFGYTRWQNSMIQISKKVGKAKHNVKVHIFAGISRRGATSIIIFENFLDSKGFKRLIERSVLPFVRNEFPDGHRLYMDNDPKHTSRYTKFFLETKQINHFKSPAQSPVSFSRILLSNTDF